MLILTRRPQEVVIIGTNIQVRVLDVQGDRVRLGVSAPSVIKVLRQELQAQPNPSRISNVAPP